MASNVVITATTSAVPAGATTPSKTPSGSTFETILASPQGPGSYIYTSTSPGTNNARIVLGFTNSLTATQYLHTVAVEHIQAYRWDWGIWYPSRLTGFVNGVAHHRTFAVPGVPQEKAAPSNTTNLDPYFTYLVGAATDRATDGTLWRSCDRFEVEWKVHQTQLYNANGTPYNYSGAFYYLGYTGLILNYTALPVVGSITPGGSTILAPQTTIGWWTTGSPQSSYRVMIFPTTAVDSTGKAVTNSAFNPLLATPEWDSGQVRSEATSAFISSPLVDGGHYTFVRAWTDSPDGEIAGAWVRSTLWATDAENPNLPTVAIADDSATYTTRITIAPAAPVGGFVNPHFYEVEYQDATGAWVPLGTGYLTGNTTTIIYDALKAPGATVSFRARSRYTRTDQLTVVSAWVTASAAVANKKEWWLRSVTDRNLNRSLSDLTALAMREWKPARQRPQTVVWGIGSKYATVTQDVVKSRTMTASVWAMSAAAWAGLDALLAHDGDLVLVSPWAETWKVRVGGEVEEDQVRAAPRTGETTPLGLVRVVNFSLVEVA